MYAWNVENHEFVFENSRIQPLTSVECLGAILEQKCKPKLQVQKICDKLKAIRILTAQNFRSRSFEILQKMYTAFILPHLDFVSFLWFNDKPMVLNPIEREFKAFWRLSPNKKPPKDLTWPREHLIANDLGLLHDIESGSSPIRFADHFERSTVNPDRILTVDWSLACKRDVFSERAKRYWNQMDKSDKILSKKVFKTKVIERLKNDSSFGVIHI